MSEAPHAESSSQSPLSNAASVVGRRIGFLHDEQQQERVTCEGWITAYDPVRGTHTVTTDGGEERVVLLNKCSFTFLVVDDDDDVEFDPKTWKERKLLAIQRDAVERKIKVYNKKEKKYLKGTIVAFNEETKRHRVLLKYGKDEYRHHNIDLSDKRVKWDYTDYVDNITRSNTSLASSKYAGVQRASDISWDAFEGRITKKGRIGTFRTEKDAALAHDCYARKKHLEHTGINFQSEQIDEAEVERRRLKVYDFSDRAPTRGPHCKSQYRGVHWQKNRKRWMARYSRSGQKHVNIGAFLDPEHAAMAFDFEARKRGRPECDLNFPDRHPTEDQIRSWSSNTAHYTMMRQGRKRTSQYRGVTWNKSSRMWHAQCNMKVVLNGLGKEKGPVRAGISPSEKVAALMYDRLCRKYGVAEKELNFPRNDQFLNEVRLFDDECYFCQKESPSDPVATPCNHVFCRDCIEPKLESDHSCPCCGMIDLKGDDLRSVTLIPFPKKEKKHSESEFEDPKDGGGYPSERDADGHHHPPGDVEIDAEEAEEMAVKSNEDPAPKCSIGTRFEKKFEGLGTFDGRIVGYDGQFYRAYSSDDEDEEELSENELDNLLTVRAGPGSAMGGARVDDDKLTPVRTDGGSKCAKPSGDSEEYPFSETDESDDECTHDIEGDDRPKENDSPGEVDKNVRKPKYSIGTEFAKTFEGHGTFKGRIIGFDGEHYSVCYSEDDDEEELSESELDSLVDTLPASQTSASRRNASTPTASSKTEAILNRKDEKTKQCSSPCPPKRIENQSKITIKPRSAPKGANRESSDLENSSCDDTQQVIKHSKNNGGVEIEKLPKYKIGTEFYKQFDAHGLYKGRIVGYASGQYTAYYSEDDDEEELSEGELDRLVSSSPSPSSRTKRGSGLKRTRSDRTVKSPERYLPEEHGSSRKKAIKEVNLRDETAKYSIGTEFEKHFEGHGTFKGRIVGFDGNHYKVYYPDDGDKEELSEGELDSLVVTALEESEEEATRKRNGCEKQEKTREPKAEIGLRARRELFDTNEDAAIGRSMASGGEILSKATSDRPKKQKRTRASSAVSPEKAASSTLKKQKTELILEPHPTESSRDKAAKKKANRNSVGKDALSNKTQANKSKDAQQPTYSIGTEFVKEVAGRGALKGRIVGYDGGRYQVCYSDELSERELYDLLN